MDLMGYKAVASVKFISGVNTAKVYQFALYDDTISVGDQALVRSNNSARGCENFGVVTVTAITPVSEYNGANPTSEVICKIDMSAYKARLAKRELRGRLKKKMDSISKKELLVYKIIASTNPEMEELLTAYQDTLDA